MFLGEKFAENRKHFFQDKIFITSETEWKKKTDI